MGSNEREVASVISAFSEAASHAELREMIIPLIESLGYDSESLRQSANSLFSIGTPEGRIQPEPMRRPYVQFVLTFLDPLSEAGPDIPTGMMLMAGEERVDAFADSLKEVKDVTGAQFVVYISNSEIFVYRNEVEVWIPYGQDRQDSLEKLIELLSATSFPSEDLGKAANIEMILDRPEWESVKLNTENVHLEMAEYYSKLKRVYTASSTAEKGNSLENLAEVLFSSIKSLTLQTTNLRTTTSEIDLIYRHSSSLGEYVLVECKNWGKPMDSKAVRDFEGKLQGTNSGLGIIVAPEGLTGEDGRDAVERANEFYKESGKVIVLFEKEDLNSIATGENPHELLREKIFQRKFRPLYE